MSISFDNAPGLGHDTDSKKHPRDPRAHDPSGRPNGFGRGTDGGSPGAPRSVLIRIIEGEIIPRLFLAHRDQAPRNFGKQDEIHADVLGDPESFARLFMTGDTADIVNRLQVFIDRGVRRERIYLEMLTPVGRLLGIMWEDGRCTFDEMANGLACIDRVLQEMNAREAAAAADGA